MTRHRLLTPLCAFAMLLLLGCAANNKEGRTAQRPRLGPPAQASNSLRLVIYRPQALVGMWGRPFVIVNGQMMVTSLRDSLLDPGSVFVVDAPENHTQVTWLQSRQTVPSTDPLVFQGLPGATRYLRWTLKPTYGYLELVPEDIAREEIIPLHYMGYRNVVVTE